MHALELLHKQLLESCTHINRASLNRLLSASSTLLHGSKLSLTHIGRYLPGKAKVKNKIKAINYLLGNRRLHNQRSYIYQTLAHWAIGQKKSIDVLVDWSPCGNRKQQLLRASLVHPSKSVTVYEEVHDESPAKGRRQVEFEFLNKLKVILPEQTQVTIITDAGFKCPWFNHVISLGWDFIGRVRAQSHFTLDNKTFFTLNALHAQATLTPQYVGHVKLTRANQLACHMYLVKEKSSKSQNKKRPILSSAASKKYHAKEVSRTRTKAQEPWVLVTSKKHQYKSEQKIVPAYQTRMKIEHDFRTAKNIRWGMGLDYARSHDKSRLEMLLLIATIAIFVLWLIGLSAEIENIHLQFQANTIKHRRVLSLVFLGMQVLLHLPDFVSTQQLNKTSIQLMNAF